MAAMLRDRRRRRCRRAYAPTSNTAAVYGYGASLGGPSGRQSSAINRVILANFQRRLLKLGSSCKRFENLR